SRGFAGQVMFLIEGNDTPAMVDGKVEIFLFDDQGDEEANRKPIHKFEFSPEAWAVHAMKGKLGLTYGVFVPYTREGRREAKCGLAVKFTPKQGPVVTSSMET